MWILTVLIWIAAGLCFVMFLFEMGWLPLRRRRLKTVVTNARRRVMSMSATSAR